MFLNPARISDLIPWDCARLLTGQRHLVRASETIVGAMDR
jgi:hypothetical protein